jgi:uncharacterized protein YceK
MKSGHNWILAGVFLACMALIVLTGCTTVVHSDEPQWEYPTR